MSDKKGRSGAGVTNTQRQREESEASRMTKARDDARDAKRLATQHGGDAARYHRMAAFHHATAAHHHGEAARHHGEGRALEGDLHADAAHGHAAAAAEHRARARASMPDGEDLGRFVAEGGAGTGYREPEHGGVVHQRGITDTDEEHEAGYGASGGAAQRDVGEPQRTQGDPHVGTEARRNGHAKGGHLD